MSTLRPCLEFCCSPNTVSKFIRFFPRAALFFFILHVAIIIYSSMNTSKKEEVAFQGSNYIPKDPQHRRDFARLEATLRNTSVHENKTKKYLHHNFAKLQDQDPVHRFKTV
ncbi:hypothetical protein KP79_PYT05774 [Mizuhopecten yessoensis]|uniref:Uncharacterized protein n=1 Tax=Mizuhopecten yessoensis TaxID=6573 RepID=A0A210QVB4_MIZYE|nr:hypothetical protein KP79_PYT05774 [Mizuhopecten yessoensis]